MCTPFACTATFLLLTCYSTYIALIQVSLTPLPNIKKLGSVKKFALGFSNAKANTEFTSFTLPIHVSVMLVRSISPSVIRSWMEILVAK